MQTYTMKDSGVEWVKALPKDWRLTKVQHIFNVKDGTHDTPNYENSEKGNYPFVTSKDITDNKIDFSSTKYISRTYFEKYKTRSDVSYGDIIMPMIGTIGNSAIVDTNIEFSIKNVALFKTSDCNKINTKFFFYFLESKINKDQFYLLSKGGVQSFLSLTTLRNLKLVTPSINEQKAIANYLDKACKKIDKTIAIKQQQLEKLEAYRKSVIHEAVTKGLDKNVAMKDSGVERIGTIPKHWKTSKIKRITEIDRGKFNHRPRNDPDYYNGKYPFIQTGDVTNANKFIKTYSQTLNEKGFSVSKQFPSGTLTMTIAANIGDVAILEFNACFPDSVLGFKPLHMIDVEYLYYLFIGLNDDILSTAIVTTQLNLNIVRVGTVACGLPPKKEQNIITKKLRKMERKIDSLTNTVNSQIEKLTQYRQSLIHECVTGKKRVYQGDIN